jgi:hypothetical protein
MIGNGKGELTAHITIESALPPDPDAVLFLRHP